MSFQYYTYKIFLHRRCCQFHSPLLPKPGVTNHIKEQTYVKRELINLILYAVILPHETKSKYKCGLKSFQPNNEKTNV